MGSYKRLSLEEREEIGRGTSLGEGFREIARKLKRAASTVKREIDRNTAQGQEYRAARAQQLADKRRSRPRPRRIDHNRRLRHWVIGHLRLCWSPQQIAASLKLAFPQDRTMRLSHESLYTYLYVLPRGEMRRELLSYLRQHRKKRRPRSRGTDRRGQIPEMISIDERPAEVADRSVPGHWESDLIMGKGNRTALGTLVERTTRTTLLVRLKAKDAASVRRAFARKIKNLPDEMKLSMTHDRGKEMAEHKLFTAATKMKVYFAHPQSPWERGTNENTNGLIRQFFPKGTDFNEVSPKRILEVQDLLNGRPRKILDWKTPYEMITVLLR